METPLPVIFDRIPRHWQRGSVLTAVTTAAAEIGTLAVLCEGDIRGKDAAVSGHVIPLLETPDASAAQPGASAPFVMIPDGPDVMAVQAALKRGPSATIVAIRIPAVPTVAGRVADLVRDGAEVIHLTFDSHGREESPAPPRHMRDVLRDTHTTLVKRGIRDEVTLIASGGIAAAEHVIKAIICGADLVAIDIPLILALECRLCGECLRGQPCPITLEEIDAGFGVDRIVNLMAAWHSQFLEMLGAMGIREIRRLRGETGRCMFFEDLERDTFGRLFGKRKSGS
jgi:hypothetical protein